MFSLFAPWRTFFPCTSTTIFPRGPLSDPRERVRCYLFLGQCAAPHTHSAGTSSFVFSYSACSSLVRYVYAQDGSTGYRPRDPQHPKGKSFLRLTQVSLEDGSPKEGTRSTRPHGTPVKTKTSFDHSKKTGSIIHRSQAQEYFEFQHKPFHSSCTPSFAVIPRFIFTNQFGT